MKIYNVVIRSGYPWGDPGDSINLFDIIQLELIDLVRRLLPQLFLNRDINKFQIVSLINAATTSHDIFTLFRTGGHYRTKMVLR